MLRTVSRTTRWKSTYARVEISPATTTRPVVHSDSHATRLWGSCSKIASLIWSHILSGWPSVTDSDVNVNELIPVYSLALCEPGYPARGRSLAGELLAAARSRRCRSSPHLPDVRSRCSLRSPRLQ